MRAFIAAAGIGVLTAVSMAGGLLGGSTVGFANVEPTAAPEIEPGPQETEHAEPPADESAQMNAQPGQWYIDEYGFSEIWKESTGKGVKVAVIDSGVEASHPNIKDRVVAAKDFSGSGTDGRTPVGPEGTIHHGTAVAGVIAGTGEGVGPRGVAPDAELLSASMWLGGGGPAGSQSTRDQMAEAMRWSVDNGAKVINMSLGWNMPSWPSSWDDAFAYAYSLDAVVIACVGNRSQGATQAWSPATVPGVVGVGGLNKNGSVRPSSSAPGVAVDLMGPAEDIPVPMPGGGYGTAQGCSFAAPIISGVAALIRQQHPDWSADETVAAMTATAANVSGHRGSSRSGSPDPTVGFGKIQPKAALHWNQEGEVRSAQDALRDWVRMHRRAEAPAAASPDPQETPSSHEIADEELEPGSEIAVATSREPRLGPSILIAGGTIGIVGAAASVILWSRIRTRRRPDPPSAEDLHAPES